MRKIKQYIAYSLICFAISMTSMLQAQNLNFGDIVVNELMASNDSLSTITDPDGGTPDWLEIYNNTDEIVSLSGYYLSDNYTLPNKWAFPATAIIQPYGYLVVWADNQPDQAGIHTTFKLSSAGEEVILSKPNLEALDSLSFGQQQTNVSYARMPNGTGDFAFDETPTPNENNEIEVGIFLPAFSFSDIYIKTYPNPTSDIVFVEIENDNFNEHIHLQLLDAFGKNVFETHVRQKKIAINMQTYEAGWYMLCLFDREKVIRISNVMKF
ncbi:MAG: lamin tail domain-containing protein [Chitinophagales bacterium]